MTKVIGVRFRDGCKTYYFNPGELTVSAGESVVVETAKGPELGVCSAGNHEVEDHMVASPLRSVIRVATPEDCRTAAANRAKEPRAFEVCQQKIQEFKLDMKLVRVEYSFDGSKILFFFTSDGRVDFRELVRSLAAVFRTRIELRQIGVRDEARLLGGIGICGRPFCCNAFLEQFQPVSIKMAKTQNLSLNPAKISGACGRLMCCLKYEQEAYEDLLATAPKADSFVDTPDGTGTIMSLSILRQQAKVRLDAAPETPKTYKYENIIVIRSGKGKRPEGYDSPEEVRAKRLQQAKEAALKRQEEEEAARQAALAAAERKSRSRGGKGGGPAPEGKRDGEQKPAQKSQRSRSRNRGGKPNPSAEKKPPSPAPNAGRQTAAPAKNVHPSTKPASSNRSRYRSHRRKSGGGGSGGPTAPAGST